MGGMGRGCTFLFIPFYLGANTQKMVIQQNVVVEVQLKGFGP